MVETTIQEWLKSLVKELGPELGDLYFKPQDLAKRGDDQVEFLQSVYVEGFKDAFDVLAQHYDHFKEFVVDPIDKTRDPSSK